MLEQIQKTLSEYNALLVAVSKTKSISEIRAIYDKGIRHFGENRAKELHEKYKQLPEDIHWHMIGHLQKNKVKYIAPFVSYIHSVDSYDLLKMIDHQAERFGRRIKVLLQMKIATEESKFGMDIQEVEDCIQNSRKDGLGHIEICGLMGMATFTSDMEMVASEFQRLKDFFQSLKKDYFVNNDSFKELSMGMSGDYETALDKGATIVRIGSLIFGARI